MKTRFMASRPSGRARTVTAVAGVLMLGLSVPAGAAQADETAKPMDANTAAAAVQHSSTGDPSQAPSRVAAHWTPERIRAARPVAVPAPEGRPVAPQTQRLPARTGQGSAPVAGVSKEAGEAADAARTLADVSRSAVWTAHGSMPATTVGKLYFDTPKGGSQCTASVVNSPNKSLIWTAGHCASDGNGHWYSNWRFVPDYHNGQEPLGSWTWKSVSTPKGYLNGGDKDYDLAVITLWPQNGRKVADVTGSQGYRFNSGYTWHAHEFGYPFDTHPARSGITGQDLRYCTGTTWRPGFWPFQPGQEAIHCDQGHGASGGPWLDDLQLSRGWGYLIGNVSYHNSESSDEERSPHLGDAAVKAYDAEKNH
ncbi:hypothetical protein [Streptomyces sp. NPDC001404]|uniref:trypsin-like serine peptidase n=1 Tax=Streptomyces sp. NPDC001404 TaxID=3364571 RepID=UPI0036A743E1